ncbi:hypothetical protein PVW53_19965, partial [Seohaeicola sp. SP36]|uniref:hypothetical protein n=1 Tax=unclassified Seohaeicola TaxID=2641111 RepID=UPI00237B0D67
TVKILPPSLSPERVKVDDFYAARSRLIPPLPWPTFAPPFSLMPKRARLNCLHHFRKQIEKPRWGTGQFHSFRLAIAAVLQPIFSFPGQ